MSRTILAALTALLMAVSGLAAADEDASPSGPFVPLSELSPGDRCVALTVFEGETVEEFAVEILAIVPGTSPGGSLIIGRAEGDVLKRTGIMQGMSGSPVYLGGRLVGALSSAWPFSKEPIAGITPIEEMLPALAAIDRAERSTSSGDAPIELDLAPRGGDGASRVSWVSSVAGLDATTRAEASESRDPVYAGRALSPIGVPLVVSGGAAFASSVSGALEGTGLCPMAAASDAGRGGGSDGSFDVVPGSAVGAQLVRGDIDITAIGTLTYIDDDRVLAFGHSLFNEGSIEVPLVGARVHALMPLHSVSFKYASGTDAIGTLVQDNNRMVAGVLGPPPPMIPFDLTVDVAGSVRTFSFQVARSRRHAAAFSGLAAAAAISEAAKSGGPSTIELAVSVTTSGETIEYDDMFYSSAPAMAAPGELSALMNLVLFNRFERRDVLDVSARVSIREERLSAEIERVTTEKAVYSRGDTLKAAVTLRRWQGESETLMISLKIPESAPDGPLTLVVSGAGEFHESEAARLGPGLAPRSYEQLLALVDRSRPGDSVSVQILSGAPGVSLSGDEIRDVPGRAALVMASSGRGGSVDRVEQSSVAESHYRTGMVVTGYHELTLHMEPRRSVR